MLERCRRVEEYVKNGAPCKPVGEKRHPTESPGTAENVKYGRTVSASESLTCIAPLASPSSEDIYVRAT